MESDIIKVEDMQFKVLLTEEAINEILKNLAAKINKAYAGKTVDVIIVLKGGYVFGSDITKLFTFNHRIHFVKFTSYEGLKSTNVVRNDVQLNADIEGKHVLILEDIIDTGQTMQYFLHQLETENVASKALCTFLLKPESLTVELDIDYVGCEIDDAFVIGYGMDYNELYRSLSSIYQKI